MNKTAVEWAAWNNAETCSVDAAKRIPEIISDLAACERERDRLKDAFDEQARQDKGALDGLRSERDALKAENAKPPDRWYSEEAMAAVVRERDKLQADSTHAIGVVADLIVERDALRSALEHAKAHAHYGPETARIIKFRR